MSARTANPVDLLDIEGYPAHIATGGMPLCRIDPRAVRTIRDSSGPARWLGRHAQELALRSAAA